MDTIVDKSDPYICNCELCQKMGPLYASMHRYNNSLSPEYSTKSDNKKELLKKNNIINIICIIFITILFLITSKYYII